MLFTIYGVIFRFNNPSTKHTIITPLGPALTSRHWYGEDFLRTFSFAGFILLKTLLVLTMAVQAGQEIAVALQCRNEIRTRNFGMPRGLHYQEKMLLGAPLPSAYEITNNSPMSESNFPKHYKEMNGELKNFQIFYNSLSRWLWWLWNI